ETTTTHAQQTLQPNGADATFASDFEANLFVVDVLVMVLSLSGNVCAIVYIRFCPQKKVKSTHNISVVSIAVADLLVACFVLPSSLVTQRVQPAVAARCIPFLCKLSRYIRCWARTVSVYSIVAMVFEKYMKVGDNGQ
ncbi:hypothetical protein LSAT2_029776, partial [Lamellibrachia satsuma]